MKTLKFILVLVNFLIIENLYSQPLLPPTYTLTARNLQQISSNALTFEIYLKNTNPDSTTFEYNTSFYYLDFNPANIGYDLAKDNFITLKIYDILGREIVTLINEFKKAGSYTTSFDALNMQSGIYYYILKTDGYDEIKKMIILSNLKNIMPKTEEYIFRIRKTKDTVKLIDYLTTLSSVKELKEYNGEKKILPIRYRNKGKDIQSLFGIWKNDKRSLKEIRKNWDRNRQV